MIYDNRYLGYQYYIINNGYQPSLYQANHTVNESSIYQDDINKCLTNVNIDYNSYNPTFTYDSSCLSNSQDYSQVKDSGIAEDIEVTSSNTNIADKKLHIHQNKFDEDNCQYCRDATYFLLSIPFINYFDYKFKAPDSTSVSLCSDEINYVEYKMLDNFQFAKPKRIMPRSPYSNWFSNQPLDFEYMQKLKTEFECNGKTTDILNKDVLHENEVPRQYSLTQYDYDYKNELYSFQPNANSTPSKYLLNQQQQQQQQQLQQQQQYCLVNIQNQFIPNNPIPWKKPVVLDPRLSARYDAVFPSLDKQSNSISTMDNYIYCCVFCKNNGENEILYTSHVLRDPIGRICCPILRKYECPICGATGDAAHTLKYCPMNYGLKVQKQSELNCRM